MLRHKHLFEVYQTGIHNEGLTTAIGRRLSAKSAHSTREGYDSWKPQG